MLRRVAAFCRPLRPVLPLVSFPRSRSPVVGVPGLCWMWRDVPFARPPPLQMAPHESKSIRMGVRIIIIIVGRRTHDAQRPPESTAHTPESQHIPLERRGGSTHQHVRMAAAPTVRVEWVDIRPIIVLLPAGLGV